MEIGMFPRDGSRVARRRRGCRGLSRNRTSRMRAWRGCRRGRCQILPIWRRRFPRYSGNFVSSIALLKKACTDLEVLCVLLVVDYFGNALHSLDANDTLES